MHFSTVLLPLAALVSTVAAQFHPAEVARLYSKIHAEETTPSTPVPTPDTYSETHLSLKKHPGSHVLSLKHTQSSLPTPPFPLPIEPGPVIPDPQMLSVFRPPSTANPDPPGTVVEAWNPNTHTVTVTRTPTVYVVTHTITTTYVNSGESTVTSWSGFSWLAPAGVKTRPVRDMVVMPV